MNYKDEAIKNYYTLKPAQFGYLESFSLFRKVEHDRCSPYYMELVLLSFRFNVEQLCLSFSGVQDIKIGDIGGLMSLQIDIRSVSEQQMENLNFKVVESEYETFSFLCTDFKAEIKQTGRLG
ncbi:MAG: hypothetical protein GY795_00750 [Desulfobacterales bacterium]|nr:hypothetical protein [Desulfobacterales bacterium]